MLDVVIVPVIVMIVYLIVEAYKYIVKNRKDKENWLHYIPIIAGVLGSVLGIIAYLINPEIIPAKNVFVAIIMGAASGLSATGVNQIFKQLKK